MSRTVLILDQFVLDTFKVRAGFRSDEALCTRVGIPQWQFSRARRGLILPEAQRVKLAEVLGVPVGRLWKQIDLGAFDAAWASIA